MQQVGSAALPKDMGSCAVSLPQASSTSPMQKGQGKFWELHTLTKGRGQDKTSAEAQCFVACWAFCSLPVSESGPGTCCRIPLLGASACGLSLCMVSKCFSKSVQDARGSEIKMIECMSAEL